MTSRTALLLAALAACNAAPDASPDAGTPVDPGPPDAGPCTIAETPTTSNSDGLMEVRVHLDGTPTAGATVIVQDQDGAPLRRLITRDDGTTLLEIAANQQLTVIANHNGEVDAWTIAGLGEGAVIDIGEPAPPVLSSSVTLSLPEAPPHAHVEVWSHDVGLEPATDGSPLVFPIDPSHPVAVLALAVADDGQDTPLSASSVSGAPGDTLTLPPLAPFGRATVTLHDVPAGTTDAVDALLPTSRSTLILPFGSASVTGATAQVDTPWTTPLPGAVVFWSVSRTGADQYGFVEIPADATSADVSPRWLPWVTDMTYDDATRTATWSTDGCGGADGALLEVDGASGGHTWRWQMLAPIDGGTVSLPTLPDDLAALFGGAGGAGFELVGDPDGYRALREHPFRRYEPTSGVSYSTYQGT